VACVVNVLGADRPGIVYRVTAILQEEGGNIIDLQTQVGGAAHRPVYAMVIDVELAGEERLEALRRRLAEAARELSVEVSVRRSDTLTL
ncbi:MAG: ACT domain-containing protein, partial [Magnetococcales bacterium]|nr:ACT domain-containing protein [Magnetococcales bacterium]